MMAFGLWGSSLWAFCFLWLVLVHPVLGASGQLRRDADANSEQQYGSIIHSEGMEERHLWGGGGRIRDNVNVGAATARRRSDRSWYVPKYGRRYDTTSESEDSLTASDQYGTATSQQQNYFHDYHAYKHNSPSYSASHRTRPCRKSKPEGRSRYRRSFHRHRSKISSSKGKSKSKSNKGSSSKSRGGGKSKGGSRKGRSDYYRYYDACEEEEGGNEEAIVCSASIQDFTSSVAVLFSGEPQFLTAPEQIALEGSFQDTYNTLTFANCDGYFRRIESVSLFVPAAGQRRRRLQTSNSSADAGDFSVTGNCRNCPVTTAGVFSLFDDSFRRRNLQSAAPARYGGGGGGGGSRGGVDLSPNRASTQSDICICPDQGGGRLLQLQQEDLEPNAPSEEDFLIAYNNDIERLVDEGIVSNVDSIRALSEAPLEEEVAVMCSPNILEFVTHVLVEFDGDATALTEMELSIIGILFEQVYNELTFGDCDGYFRMTDDTTLIPEQGTSPSFFRVGATCRDCPVNNDGSFSIFDNLRRFLAKLWLTQLGGLVSNKRKSNQRVRGAQEASDDVCFCLALSDNLDTLAPSAPSAPEVQQLLNERIAELRSAGMIINIFRVSSMIESLESPVVEQTPDLDDTQTADPTMPPSAAEAPPETAVPTLPDVPPETAAPTMVMAAETATPTSMATESAIPVMSSSQGATDLPTAMAGGMTIMPSKGMVPPPKTAMPSPMMKDMTMMPTKEAAPPPKTAMPSPMMKEMTMPPKDGGDGTNARQKAPEMGTGSVIKGSRVSSPNLEVAGTDTMTQSEDSSPSWSAGSQDSPTWSPTLTALPETNHPTPKPTSIPPGTGRRRMRIRRPGRNRLLGA